MQAPSLLERVSVLERHEVVEDGVDGGREVVEESGDVVQVLVDRPEDDRLLQRRYTARNKWEKEKVQSQTNMIGVFSPNNVCSKRGK